MDPSVYARAHGVQSEANNVTVTRVACGEIMYRRAIDTYRRDMKYKLSCLRKEQKRLRGCMRGYRRKLRESGQNINGRNISTEEGTLGKYKLPMIGHVTVDGESSNPGVSSTVCYGAVANDSYPYVKPDNSSIIPNASSAPTAEKQCFLDESEINNSTGKLSCYSAITQPTETNETYHYPSILAPNKQSNEDNLNCCHIMVENVGRTVRIGSGKIGASSKQVHVSLADSELEDDAFADVSDSSDDEYKLQEETDPTEVVSFRNGVFVREITPLTLMKRRAAYFKSLPKEMDVNRKVSQEKSECARDDANENTDVDTHTNLQSNSKVSVADCENHSEINQLLVKGIPLQSMIATSNQFIKKTSEDNEKTETAPKLRKRKEMVGVSFNDIMKISISNNTKKLFSLVDRLAKTNGIPVTPIERPSKDRLIRKDPRELTAAVRRAHVAGATKPETTSQGSVFYAIKYGYVPLNEDPKKADGVFRASSNGGQARHGILTTDLSSQSTSLNHLFETSHVPTTKQTISLNPADNEKIFPTSLSSTKSEEGLHFSYKTSDHGNRSELASFVSEQIDKQRDKRRSSILEASNFVSAARLRRSFVVNYTVSEENKRERDIFFRPRKGSVKREHVELSENHKESWASAFSRIKMIHTLVDLTHVI